MKKKMSLVLAFLSLMFTMNAQVFDLTTGTDGSGGMGAPGTNDGIWTYEGPGGGGFLPVPISTGSLQSGGTVYPNAYVHDNCGQWISPWLNAANNIISSPGTQGTFTYKMTFNVDLCDPTAVMDLGFMAADNNLTEVRVNGVIQTIPSPITHLIPGSMSSTPAVMTGTNTIEIDTYNAGAYTALQLCGSITVSGINLEIPTGLECCDVEAGELLSWLSIPGAIGYEVLITINDPDCCPPGEVDKIKISVTDNYYFFPSSGKCYSWQVRAVYSPKCKSKYSEKLCTCDDPCKAPTGLKCEVEGNYIILSWLAVTGALGYEVEITYDDPDCCPAGGLPTSIMLGGTDLFQTVQAGKCFSWRVRSRCEDGTTSAWSEKLCSCELGEVNNKMDNNQDTRTSASEVNLSKDPNPASDFVTFNVENPTRTLSSNRCQLIIYDMNGVKVLESSIKLDQDKKVDVSKLTSGMYICKILSDDRIVATDKLLIEK